MDEEYIQILNQCIVSVEDILETSSYEVLPYCRFILDKSIPGMILVVYKRGTQMAPARTEIGDTRPQLLIKDAHD